MIVLKISQLPSKLRFSANCSFFGQSFSPGHYPLIYQPPKGVYLLNIPALPNMVNERISEKRKLDKNFPSKPVTIKNRLAAELTSRYLGTGPKYKWNSPLHCSECFRMTKTSAITVTKKFFSQPRENFPCY